MFQVETSFATQYPHYDGTNDWVIGDRSTCREDDMDVNKWLTGVAMAVYLRGWWVGGFWGYPFLDLRPEKWGGECGFGVVKVGKPQTFYGSMSAVSTPIH